MCQFDNTADTEQAYLLYVPSFHIAFVSLHMQRRLVSVC